MVLNEHFQEKFQFVGSEMSFNQVHNWKCSREWHFTTWTNWPCH